MNESLLFILLILVLSLPAYYLSDWWNYGRKGWKKIDRLPDWVWKSYKNQPRHPGEIYTYKGRHYQYRAVVDGVPGTRDEGYREDFYRRKRHR